MISDTGIWTIVINLIAVAFAVQYSRSETFGHALLWLAWDFTGLRFIATKVFPNRKGSTTPPVTITLWVIGVYTALFGIASNRYENAVDKIENRMNAFITQLAVIKDPNIWRSAFIEVGEIQNMKCPVHPDLLKPSTVFLSLVKDDSYDEAVIVLTRTVEKNKDNLDGVLLINANLKGAKLDGANLEGAGLEGANLELVHLRGANLMRAKLRGANLEHVHLRGANLKDAGFDNAIFKSADIRGVKELGAENLCFVGTLFGTFMDPSSTRHVEIECPEKLEKPD